MNDTIEIEAALAAQRLLIEVLYAQAFAADPAGLARLMSGLVRLTRDAPSTAEPTDPEYVIEWQARVTTHLERFAAAVQHRIASGRRV